MIRVSTTAQLVCDGCGCAGGEERTAGESSGHRSIDPGQAVRAHCRQSGWSYRPTPEGWDDLCPACAEQRLWAECAKGGVA